MSRRLSLQGLRQRHWELARVQGAVHRGKRQRGRLRGRLLVGGAGPAAPDVHGEALLHVHSVKMPAGHSRGRPMSHRPSSVHTAEEEVRPWRRPWQGSRTRRPCSTSWTTRSPMARPSTSTRSRGACAPTPSWSCLTAGCRPGTSAPSGAPAASSGVAIAAPRRPPAMEWPPNNQARL